MSVIEVTTKVETLLATIERLRQSNIDLGSRLGQSEAKCEQLAREVARLREQLEEVGGG